jgi:mRNA interferase MazF
VIPVRFPFSGLSQTKLRPAIVLADAGREDWVLRQVTSNAYGDPRAIELGQTDFAVGSLHVVSYARPGRLFTASRSLMQTQVGKLKAQRLGEIIESVVTLLRGGAC